MASSRNRDTQARRGGAPSPPAVFRAACLSPCRSEPVFRKLSDATPLPACLRYLAILPENSRGEIMWAATTRGAGRSLIAGNFPPPLLADASKPAVERAT